MDGARLVIWPIPPVVPSLLSPPCWSESRIHVEINSFNVTRTLSLSRSIHSSSWYSDCVNESKFRFSPPKPSKVITISESIPSSPTLLYSFHKYKRTAIWHPPLLPIKSQKFVVQDKYQEGSLVLKAKPGAQLVQVTSADSFGFEIFIDISSSCYLTPQQKVRIHSLSSDVFASTHILSSKSYDNFNSSPSTPNQSHLLSSSSRNTSSTNHNQTPRPNTIFHNAVLSH